MVVENKAVDHHLHLDYLLVPKDLVKIVVMILVRILSVTFSYA
jgi:hypothetical protein